MTVDKQHLTITTLVESVERLKRDLAVENNNSTRKTGKL